MLRWAQSIKITPNAGVAFSSSSEAVRRATTPPIELPIITTGPVMF